MSTARPMSNDRRAAIYEATNQQDRTYTPAQRKALTRAANKAAKRAREA